MAGPFSRKRDQRRANTQRSPQKSCAISNCERAFRDHHPAIGLAKTPVLSARHLFNRPAHSAGPNLCEEDVRCVVPCSRALLLSCSLPLLLSCYLALLLSCSLALLICCSLALLLSRSLALLLFCSLALLLCCALPSRYPTREERLRVKRLER